MTYLQLSIPFLIVLCSSNTVGLDYFMW